MDENDPLFEDTKIPLSQNRASCAFTPKSTSMLRSALYFRYSIVKTRLR